MSLIVKVRGHVRECTDRAFGVAAARPEAQASHVHHARAGADAAGGNVGHVLQVVRQGLNVQVAERLAGQRLNRNRHVLDVLGATLRSDDDFLQRSGAGGVTGTPRRIGGESRVHG